MLKTSKPEFNLRVLIISITFLYCERYLLCYFYSKYNLIISTYCDIRQDIINFMLESYNCIK